MERMVEKYGVWGIAAAMFTESVGVPFASTVVFLSSGGLIYSGKISFGAVFMAYTAGITLGSVAGYLLGYLSRAMGSAIRATFLGRSLNRRLSGNNDNSRVWEFIENYGNISIFMAQLFGVTRTFISFPAGILKLNLPLFTIYTALGAALFSLGSICLSMVLASVVRMFYRCFRLFLTLPFWVWIVCAALVALLIWVYRRLGWKFPLNKFIAQGKAWLKRKK